MSETFTDADKPLTPPETISAAKRNSHVTSASYLSAQLLHMRGIFSSRKRLAGHGRRDEHVPIIEGTVMI